MKKKVKDTLFQKDTDDYTEIYVGSEVDYTEIYVGIEVDYIEVYGSIEEDQT